MRLAVLENIKLMPNLSRVFRQLKAMSIVLVAALFLSGCVRYDVGVNFDSPHQGEIIQHIKLGEQLTSFNRSQAQAWLQSLERRARELQGKTKYLSDEEIVVKIPFYTGAELESKFNQFFYPNLAEKPQSKADAAGDLPNFESKLNLSQSNFLFLLRNKLSYDLDLRSLGVLSSSNNVVVNPGSLFDLEFRLNTPWGARSIKKSDNAIAPVVMKKGHQLVWKLQPGEINHIEAAFWLPSPIGIGTLLIILFVLGGFFLKYKRLPGLGVTTSPTATLQKS